MMGDHDPEGLARYNAEAFGAGEANPVPQQPSREQVEPCHATGTNRQAMYRGFWSKATRRQWQEMRMR